MKIQDILKCPYEVIFLNAYNETINESATRAYQRVGHRFIRKFRCTSGAKKGRIVTHPSDCFHRKDPNRVRIGRKTMRTRGNTIRRKSAISKHSLWHTMLRRKND